MDELGLMDTANMLGAVAGVVGAGYAGAAYHEQRRLRKEETKRGADLERGERRDMGTQVGITIETEVVEEDTQPPMDAAEARVAAVRI